mgnify:CR=1 FL=1
MRGMKRKKFTGPAILAGSAVVIWLGINVLGGLMYDEGDTVDSGVAQTFLCMGGTSILMCLSSIVWFALALGTKTQGKVFLAKEPDDFQHPSVPPASDSLSTVVPSTIGGEPVLSVREKFIIAKSEGNAAQMVGFLFVAGSVVMFGLMIILGFMWILSGIGPGLGGSGGTCDETCESLGSAAEFSMWASLLLFPCGVIALARPWSWFSSDQDIRDPVVKVRVGIVAGIALIAVISFGWPALLVVGMGLTTYAATRWADE